jgi:putative transposase
VLIPWSTSKIAKGERGLWQRRYWEHMIRDAKNWRRYVEYCWMNPVKHGLVGTVRDWPLSSFHRDVRRGLVPEDWAGDVAEGGSGSKRRWWGRAATLLLLYSCLLPRAGFRKLLVMRPIWPS